MPTQFEELDQLLQDVKNEKAMFADVIAFMEKYYNHTPTAFLTERSSTQLMKIKEAQKYCRWPGFTNCLPKIRCGCLPSITAQCWPHPIKPTIKIFVNSY